MSCGIGRLGLFDSAITRTRRTWHPPAGSGPTWIVDKCAAMCSVQTPGHALLGRAPKSPSSSSPSATDGRASNRLHFRHTSVFDMRLGLAQPVVVLPTRGRCIVFWGHSATSVALRFAPSRDPSFFGDGRAALAAALSIRPLPRQPLVIDLGGDDARPGSAPGPILRGRVGNKVPMI